MTFVYCACIMTFGTVIIAWFSSHFFPFTGSFLWSNRTPSSRIWFFFLLMELIQQNVILKAWGVLDGLVFLFIHLNDISRKVQFLLMFFENLSDPFVVNLFYTKQMYSRCKCPIDEKIFFPPLHIFWIVL